MLGLLVLRLRFATGVLLFGLGLQTLSPAALAADDWPQWMGPTRDGVYREDGLIRSIPADGLPIKWRVPIAAGYAGPAVQGDRVFVADYLRRSGEVVNDPGQRAELQGQERVHCLDAKTGETLWQHAYERPYSISYPNGPRCTPTVDEDRVYFLGSEGDLLCLQVDDGQVVWQRSFTKDFGAPVPIWGFASHPLVEGDLLICMVGGEGQTVVAFDKHTGEVRWKGLDASEVGYCPPVIVEAGGVRQLVVWHADALVSLNPADGQPYWSVDLKPSYGMSVSRPQREGDRLYASGIHSTSVMLQLKQDEPDVTELWRGERNHAVYTCNSTPLMDGGVIFGADCHKGSLIAADVQTGKRLWDTFQFTQPEQRRFVKQGTVFLTRLAGTDRYLLFSETGDLILATLTADGYEEHGRFHVVEPTNTAMGRQVVWSHPAYAGRTAFIRNDKEIVAVDLAR